MRSSVVLLWTVTSPVIRLVLSTLLPVRTNLYSEEMTKRASWIVPLVLSPDTSSHWRSVDEHIVSALAFRWRSVTTESISWNHNIHICWQKEQLGGGKLPDQDQTRLLHGPVFASEPSVVLVGLLRRERGETCTFQASLPNNQRCVGKSRMRITSSIV